MANIALGKSILEPDWKRSELLTNNDYINYNGSNGFAHTNWPKNLTLDLENIFEISTIRFLLWDKDIRGYKYRLLTSEDFKTWLVHYDTFENSYKGWQEFNFTQRIKARYIRIHCMWNSNNAAFHIVELQVFDKDPDALNKPITNKKVISPKENENITEIGTGLPLTQEMKNLTNSLEKLINENQALNPVPFNEIIKNLRIKTNDIESLEMSIDSIRREIISPVQRELEAGKKLGKFSVWGFYVGFAGIIVSIFAILNGVFHWV